MAKKHMKTDQYRHARGGWSRILDISCAECGRHVCFYQKDGPGPLKRMYLDRMIGIDIQGGECICEHCGQVLGMRITYQRENRLAYRLFQDSVTKRIVRQKAAE